MRAPLYMLQSRFQILVDKVVINKRQYVLN
jgi:hypothetical protein